MESSLRQPDSRVGSDRARLAPLLLLFLVLAGACTFDRSGLSSKQRECQSADDCAATELCVGGFCASQVDAIAGGDLDGPDGGTQLTDVASDMPVADRSEAADTSDDEAISPCPDTANACGGCEPLPNQPGTPCGSECGTGRWECLSQNTVRCLAESGSVNECGGCGALENPPGTPCGECAEYECGDDPDETVCSAAEVNVCGGCDPLPAVPGDPCGACGDGEYECLEDTGDLFCLGATAANACGGCETLEARPRTPCGPCADGLWECQTANTVACEGASDGNPCGGCSPLPQELGSECGTCGEWVCNDLGGVSCDDPGRNACLTCAPLEGTPGEECGRCGTLTCNEDGTELDCDDPGPNQCEGCGELAEEPGTKCGSCGVWTCDAGLSAVTCVDPGSNACGGCGELEEAPGTECGTCGIWTCNGDNSAVSCVDHGINACEACGELDGTPGEPCSCHGEGEAEWTCVGPEVVCLDDDNLPKEAREYDPVDETEEIETSGITDTITDRDWHAVDVTDVAFNPLEPNAALTSANSTDINYDLCVFFAYTGTPDITDYGCGNNRCVFYDGSEDAVKGSECSGIEEFNPAEDLYGCCDSSYGADGFEGWGVRMTDLEGFGTNDSGRAWVLVATTFNNRPEGCNEYELTIAF